MEACGRSGGPHNNFRTSCLTACRKQGDGVGVCVGGGGGGGGRGGGVGADNQHEGGLSNTLQENLYNLSFSLPFPQVGR